MSILGRWRAYTKHGSTTLMNVETAHAIVSDYASFISTSTPLPGCVADTQRLPHPKHRIKKAIEISLQSSDDSELKEELAYGFLLLSAWQESVGKQTLSLDFSCIDLGEDPLLVTENIQRHSEAINRWQPLIEAEQKKLRSELDALKNQPDFFPYP